MLRTEASCHCSLHCILPPYLLERLAESPLEKIRRFARENIGYAAEMRTMRAMSAAMPSMAAIPSPAARKHRLVYDFQNRPPFLIMLTPGRLKRSEGDPATGDPAVDEAYKFSGFTYDFYRKNFDRNSLDDQGMSLISSVHVGRSFNNAFWNGSQMAYGDGDDTIFHRFTRSMDVIGHELTHGVVTHTSNLEYQNQSGALNEHFADVFGVLVVQWKKRQTAAKADWLIGKDILVPAPTRQALRSMKAPGTAFQNDPHLGNDPQPDHMDKLYTGSADQGGVHINSGIPNRAFYLAATAMGGRAWEIPGKIWYKTLLDLTKTSKFQECAEKTMMFAAEHGSAAQNAVKNAWKAVGINV